MNTTSVNDSVIDNIGSATNVIYTVVYTMNFLIGLPINSYILCQIILETGLTSEFFTFNLVLCEIIFCLKSPLLLLNLYVIKDTLAPLMDFFEGFLGMGRPLFQTCICAERYLAVIHPVLFLRYKPLRYRLACSAIAWLVVLGCCVVSMKLYHSAFSIYMVMYVILFSVKLLCSLMILRALRNPGPGEGMIDRERANQMKMKAFKIITVIMASTVVNYISLLLLVPLQSIEEFDLIIAICISVSILTGLTQPFLYLHRAGKLSCLKGS